MNGTQLRLIVKIRKIVKKLTGKAGDVLPEGQWKDVDPVLYKEYLRLRREWNQVWKDELLSLSENAKQDTVPYSFFIERLKDKGIAHSLPQGFTGNIRTKDRVWTTREGKPIHGVPSGYMFPKIRMNPDYNEKTSPWVFQAIKADGTPGGYFYTKDFIKKSREKKFLNVGKLLQDMDKIRKKWVAIIKDNKQGELRQHAAVILELLYQFSARIGGNGNGTREGTKTYGIATLRKKHVLFPAEWFIFSYRGKDGVKTRHTFSTNDDYNLAVHIQNIISKLYGRAEEPSDFLFTYTTKSGKTKPIQPYVVNALFRELAESDEITVHKLRTMQATKLAAELIDKTFQQRKRFYNMKQAVLVLTKLAKQVGKKLNHVRRTKEGKQQVTGKTALQNYIDVALQRAFFDHYDIPLPNYLEKMVG